MLSTNVVVQSQQGAQMGPPFRWLGAQTRWRRPRPPATSPHCLHVTQHYASHTPWRIRTCENIRRLSRRKHARMLSISAVASSRSWEEIGEVVSLRSGRSLGMRRGWFCECWFRRIIELLIGFNRCWLVELFILNSEFLANWVCLSLRIGYRIIFHEMLENLFNVFFITTNEIFIKHVFFQIKIILCFSLCNKSKI